MFRLHKQNALGSGEQYSRFRKIKYQVHVNDVTISVKIGKITNVVNILE
jgi:hypothetical protein